MCCLQASDRRETTRLLPPSQARARCDSRLDLASFAVRYRVHALGALNANVVTKQRVTHDANTTKVITLKERVKCASRQQCARYVVNRQLLTIR